MPPYAWYLTLFLFTAAPTPEIHTLSLHDALPILPAPALREPDRPRPPRPAPASERPEPVAGVAAGPVPDRKSTRLNSSHTVISYAVFCLKKKKKKTNNHSTRTSTRASAAAVSNSR